MTQLDDIDLTDASVWERGVPHEWFDLLRREDPVHWHPEHDGQGFWAITKYDDIRMISKNPGLFSSHACGVNRLDMVGDELEQMRMVIIGMDPPDHHLHRGIVGKAFTPHRVAQLEPMLRAETRRAIAAGGPRGECEFVADIAARIPMWSISELMGVPEEDRQRLYELSHALIDDQDPEIAPTPAVRLDASAELFVYAQQRAERERAAPGDNLTAALLAAEVDGRRLTDMEYNLFFLFLIVAGNETTRTMAANGMRTLTEWPQQRARVLADRSLVRPAVEEMLRWAAPIHHFRRTATRDTEIRGRRIREGDKVLMWYPSANRDEEIFSEPHVFDVTRDPNEQISFGFGEHFCLGANLARLQLRVMFEELLTALPDVELAAEPRRLHSNLINGIKEMRVKFTPAATA
jgi:cholest-4-en-3-one 26-monooxygenase